MFCIYILYYICISLIIKILCNMKNTTELRESMVQLFEDLKAKRVDVQTAKAGVAISGVMVKAASLEADYNKFLGVRSEIEFLKTPK